MQVSVVLLCLVLWTIGVSALPWSPSDPMEPVLFQAYKNQKQRNLAKIQLPPQSAINFVGPRQAASLEEDDDDSYYDDGYEDGDKNGSVDYTESEEDDYEWR
ncbi:uncharacterized protein LOC133850912 [Drosophila sulfurigaster albostrigata]|uniref:uncharacterized protein LOC133850912 n=1 Tax=Drosophila sulfurigaster albostrigata TaxID=89887 RepID=UPI002D21938B|nr:uncharacterized protein LOC133850912 [Drosophila sulfurigaster albostrigata]